MKKFLLAAAGVLAAASMAVTGVSPAAAVASKTTTNHSCTTPSGAAWNVSVHLLGSAAGYQPDKVNWSVKTGSPTDFNAVTVYWFNSSGTLLQKYDYNIALAQAPRTTVLPNPSGYTVLNNFLVQVATRQVFNGVSTTLCTTARFAS